MPTVAPLGIRHEQSIPAPVDCQEEKLSGENCGVAILIESTGTGLGHALLHGQDALAWSFYILHVAPRYGQESHQGLKIGNL